MIQGPCPSTAGSSYVKKTMPLSLGNIILLKEKGGMKESIPRQVDKKSGVPEEEKGVWGPRGGERGLGFSRRRQGSGILQKEERTNFFPPSTFLSLSHIKWLFFFKPGTEDYTTHESEVAQLCLILCNPMDCSLSDSSVHGIFQAIVWEWIAISFSRNSVLGII